MPGEVPSRANIYALKSLGVEQVIAVNSVGSFKEEVKPGHLLIPDQLIDRTSQRRNTFFGDGIVAHIQFAEPFCPELSGLVYNAVKKTGATVHRGGAFITIEGPRFSTKAESAAYRQWGMSIIGMTAVPEAQLAREAEICYAAMAHVTDYDVWHETEATVTVEMLIANLVANASITKEAIANLAPTVPVQRTCECASALSTAIITQLDLIPAKIKKDLAPLLGKYVH